MPTPSDRVERMAAWLRAHRTELDAIASGSVRFDFHQDDVRVEVLRSARLPRSATLSADGPSVHPAVAP